MENDTFIKLLLDGFSKDNARWIYPWLFLLLGSVLFWGAIAMIIMYGEAKKDIYMLMLQYWTYSYIVTAITWLLYVATRTIQNDLSQIIKEYKIKLQDIGVSTNNDYDSTQSDRMEWLITSEWKTYFFPLRKDGWKKAYGIWLIGEEKKVYIFLLQWENHSLYNNYFELKDFNELGSIITESKKVQWKELEQHKLIYLNH